MLADGHIVYAAARRLDRLAELEAKGAIALKMDVTSESDCKTVVAKIIKQQKRIDVLINSAGFGLYGAMEELSIDEAKQQFEVNLFGLARLTQLVLPHMRSEKSGKIINLSSMGGKIYFPLGSWYHASKFALEGWSDCLRIELAQFNIKVVIIEPGAIATNFGNVTLDSLANRSANGPYSKMAAGMTKTLKDSYGKNNTSSPPSVVAKAIVRAVNSNRPKTRYAVGKYAKASIMLRKILPDKLFDKIVLRSG